MREFLLSNKDQDHISKWLGYMRIIPHVRPDLKKHMYIITVLSSEYKNHMYKNVHQKKLLLIIQTITRQPNLLHSQHQTADSTCKTYKNPLLTEYKEKNNVEYWKYRLKKYSGLFSAASICCKHISHALIYTLSKWLSVEKWTASHRWCKRTLDWG